MLIRQGATYHFRRRVPVAIRLLLRQSEVWVSLRTTDLRATRAMAAGLYALTEDAFATMAEKLTQQDPAAAESQFGNEGLPVFRVEAGDRQCGRRLIE
ncbi:DUF6538 domain-containing protein [Azospirillum brasilense]|uniref:DUF6538 domain-containing protein n=1 Tax=Azospirillum brasilense TaxID=192 RepID=UPI0035AB7FD1